MSQSRILWQISPRLFGLSWRYWRAGTQIVLLALFFYLFRRNEVSGAASIGPQVNDFFRLDPLAGLAVMFAGQQMITAFWPALAIVIFTLLLGRFFCGWICPLGTLLDGFYRLIRPITTRLGLGLGNRANGLRSIKYFLLGLVLFGALFQLPIIGFVDPLALLYRGLTFTLDPALSHGAEAIFGPPGEAGAASGAGASIYDFLRQAHLLAFQETTFLLAKLSGILISLAIFLLELVDRRFWCRYLCPLGGLVGLLSHFTFLRREPVKKCPNCRPPSPAEPPAGWGLSRRKGNTLRRPARCAWTAWTTAGKTWPGSTSAGIPPKPRNLRFPGGCFTSVGAGAALPLVARFTLPITPLRPDPFLIRPPGAQVEENFLALCARCGLCLKACPTNVLQPAILQAGVLGMFTPHLAMRASYCEYDCTACGQVCPTGAIPRIKSAEDKHRVVLGVAEHNPKRCLPYAEGVDCGVCEANCPVPGKAIVLREMTAKRPDGEVVSVKQPVVRKERCIGCGQCEKVCPLEGEAGVRVHRVA